MEYTGTLNGRTVKATYELSDYRINVSSIQVMTDDAWEELTGPDFEDWSEWMLVEYGDDMVEAR